MADKDPKCLFCGKPKSSGKRFIGGGGAIICEDCIKASHDILVRLKKADEERTQNSLRRESTLKRPRELVDFLNQYVKARNSGSSADLPEDYDDDISEADVVG